MLTVLLDSEKGQCHEVFNKFSSSSKISTRASYEQAKTVFQNILFSRAKIREKRVSTYSR